MRVREKRWNKPVMEKVKRGGVLAAFFAAVAVFVVMLQMEKSVLEKKERFLWRSQRFLRGEC